MMFKKGSFEIGGTIYPVTIKVRAPFRRVGVSVRRRGGAWLSFASPQYDARFGDAFWNSSKYNMVSYLLRMMTSWAIVVNVWYLPPMTIQVGLSTHQPPSAGPGFAHARVPVLREQEGEDAAQFANRVKSAIARQGGLLDLPWWAPPPLRSGFSLSDAAED